MEQERKKQTEARLLQCAKQEFLQAGYRYANLRNICKAAGVTTGACYFSFSSKEALFSAILEPLIQEYERLAAELAGKEEEHPETGLYHGAADEADPEHWRLCGCGYIGTNQISERGERCSPLGRWAFFNLKT